MKTNEIEELIQSMNEYFDDATIIDLREIGDGGAADAHYTVYEYTLSNGHKSLCATGNADPIWRDDDEGAFDAAFADAYQKKTMVYSERAIEIVEEYERRGGATHIAYGLDEDGEVAVSDGAQLPPLAVEVLPMHDGTAVYGPDTPTAPDEWTPDERTAIIEAVAADLAERIGE